MARKRQNGNGAGNGQLELSAPGFAPVVTIPAIMVPQPNGDYLVKAGKPVVESNGIGTRKAAQILGLSQRHVQALCEAGMLEWTRPGKRMYVIEIESVMKRKGNRE